MGYYYRTCRHQKDNKGNTTNNSQLTNLTKMKQNNSLKNTNYYKLTQDEINNLNILITIKEIGFVDSNFPPPTKKKKNSPGPNGFTGRFTI